MIFVDHGEDIIALNLDADIQVALLPHVIGTEEVLLIEDHLHHHNTEKGIVLEAHHHKDLEYTRNLQMTEGRQGALKRLLILIQPKKVQQHHRCL